MRSYTGFTNHTRAPREDGQAGFTLLELLVVIAILAILASLLLPVLTRARVSARTAVCLGAKRQLGVAWHLYADDNQGRLVLNNMPNPFPPAGPYSYNWTLGWSRWRDQSSEELRRWYAAGGYLESLVGPKTLLPPYLEREPRLFKCPADTFVSSLPGDYKIRPLSISMNCYMGDGDTSGMSMPKWQWFSSGTVFSRMSDFQALSPSQAWVLMDEHPDSICWAFFYVWFSPPPTQQNRWGSLPASYHNGGTVLLFADGRAIHKRWQVAATKQPVRYELDSWRPYLMKDRDYRDWLWVREHTTVARPRPTGVN